MEIHANFGIIQSEFSLQLMIGENHTQIGHSVQSTVYQIECIVFLF